MGVQAAELTGDAGMDLDLVLAGVNLIYVLALEGDGAGNFAPRPDLSQAFPSTVVGLVLPAFAAPGDVDGDGARDLGIIQYGALGSQLGVLAGCQQGSPEYPLDLWGFGYRCPRGPSPSSGQGPGQARNNGLFDFQTLLAGAPLRESIFLDLYSPKIPSAPMPLADSRAAILRVPGEPLAAHRAGA